MNSEAKVKDGNAKLKGERAKTKESHNEMFHFSETWKQILGKEISRSGRIEILYPVPETVATKNVTKVSSGIGTKSSNPQPIVEIALERKSEILKRFRCEKKRRDK